MQGIARPRKRRLGVAWGGPAFRGDVWSNPAINTRPWQRRRRAIPARYRGRLRTGGYYGRMGGGGGACSGKPELKFHDLDINDALVAANGTIAEDSVLTIPQGDGENERDGRKMCVKKIGWRFKMTLQAIDAGTPQFAETVRVILYLDTQCNGAAATAALILQTDSFQSFNNLEQGKRFKIWMDRTYDLNPHAGGGTDTGQYGLADTFFKTCNLPITYDSTATTGAIATLRDNNIGVLLLGDQGAVVAFESKMRVRFMG